MGRQGRQVLSKAGLERLRRGIWLWQVGILFFPRLRGGGRAQGRTALKGSFSLRAGAQIVQTWSGENAEETGTWDQRQVHIAGVGPGEGDGVFSGQREQRGFGVSCGGFFLGRSNSE